MTGPPAGKLIVLSGPSGVGKSTLLQELRTRFPDRLVQSVSATTRPPRPGERDGVDYYFLSPEQFAAWRRQGKFLECFQVFGSGYWYGTPHAAVRSGIEAGKWVILDVDVQGARAIVTHYPDAVTIFVRPSTFEQLERRLRGRGTESQQAIAQRLAGAAEALRQADEYRYQVINDSVADAVDQISQILTRSEGTTPCSTP